MTAPASESVVIEELGLTSGPLQLVATVVRPCGPRAARSCRGILFLHGLASDRSGYVVRARRAAVELGATCLAVDLSGHGESTGTLAQLAPRQHLGDVATAYDALAARPDLAPDRIGVCAASYGAFLAVLLTGDRDVARLLLRAPTIVADRDLDRPLGERGGDRRPESARVWAECLRTYGGPVLVLESERDEVIPRAVIDAYLSLAPTARHEVLPGATHALLRPEWRASFETGIGRFFADL